MLNNKRAMAINKNSNAYIIIYTVVMVVIVGALLAILATSLKDRQDAEVLKEQQFSIMRALGVANEDSDKDEMVALFEDDNKGVTIYAVSGSEAAITEDTDEVFELLGNRKALREKEESLPIFQYGDTYVIPMAGKGLWDDIWGFIALQKTEDGTNYKVSGIVMDHKGETPGLGAEIATAAVQDKFIGMTLFDAEGNIAVQMLKGGMTNKSAVEGSTVDAISGGTKTCDGVNKMIKASIGKYAAFLKAQLGATTPAEVEAPAEDEAPVEGETPAEETVTEDTVAEDVNVESNNDKEE